MKTYRRAGRRRSSIAVLCNICFSSQQTLYEEWRRENVSPLIAVSVTYLLSFNRLSLLLSVTVCRFSLNSHFFSQSFNRLSLLLSVTVCLFSFFLCLPYLCKLFLPVPTVVWRRGHPREMRLERQSATWESSLRQTSKQLSVSGH